MSKAIMLVRTGPSDPAREAEFNEWLTSRHIPDVLEIEGFGSARRFRASDVTITAEESPPSPSYMHFYELESDGTEADLSRIARRLLEAIQSGAAALSDDLDLSVTTTHFYVAIGDPVDAR